MRIRRLNLNRNYWANYTYTVNLTGGWLPVCIGWFRKQTRDNPGAPFRAPCANRTHSWHLYPVNTSWARYGDRDLCSSVIVFRGRACRYFGHIFTLICWNFIPPSICISSYEAIRMYCLSSVTGHVLPSRSKSESRLRQFVVIGVLNVFVCSFAVPPCLSIFAVVVLEKGQFGCRWRHYQFRDLVVRVWMRGVHTCRAEPRGAKAVARRPKTYPRFFFSTGSMNM